MGHVAGNGRSIVGSAPYRLHSDMETQIHHLEQEAYSSVLRAFKAQSDAITWVFTVATFLSHFCVNLCISCLKVVISSKCIFQDKEGLITELRKELRVSDDEHRELLAKVNADDIIQRIRFKYFMEQWFSCQTIVRFARTSLASVF